jgi:hypothetical protein
MSSQSDAGTTIQPPHEARPIIDRLERVLIGTVIDASVVQYPEGGGYTEDAIRLTYADGRVVHVVSSEWLTIDKPAHMR